MRSECLIKLGPVLINFVQHILLIISQLFVDLGSERHQLTLQSDFPRFKIGKLLFHFVHVVKVFQIQLSLDILRLFVNSYHKFVLGLFTVSHLCLERLLQRFNGLHHFLISIVLHLSLLNSLSFDLSFMILVVVIKVF